MPVEGGPYAPEIISEDARVPVRLYVGILAEQEDEVVFNAVIGEVETHAVEKAHLIRAEGKLGVSGIGDGDCKILKGRNVQRGEWAHGCQRGVGCLP